MRFWFNIKKLYQNEEFKDDESSLGYKIDVYQESINKTFSEYLVNYEYLIQLIENYGFVLVERDEARSLGLPNSIGNFDQLYYEMQSQIKTKKIKRADLFSAPDMTTDEKKISFLNKYFIFKKIRNVEYNSQELISKKQDLKDKTIENEALQEFEKIDQELQNKEKKDLDEESKKLAEKYLQENQDLEKKLEQQIVFQKIFAF